MASARVISQALEEVRARIADDRVEIVVATKYVPIEDLATLHEAGVTLIGENRAQDLQAKHAEHGERFTFDFIGHLQSRKVRQIVPLVGRIHSLASDSAADQLARHGRPDLEVLLEVNVAGEDGKSGLAPGQLDALLDRLHAGGGCTPVGLMTMPPQARDPEHSRRWFAALRELAAARDLRHLSMGTSQDFEVAVQEGATIVRIGSRILSPRG